MYNTILSFLQNEVAGIAALISVIVAFGGAIVAFKTYIRKQEKVPVIDVSLNILSATPEIEIISKNIKEENRSHAIEVAERLEFLLKEFSDSHYKLTHSMFARWLGYETAAPLEALLAATEAPTFQTLIDIAECLGVSREWLIDGNGQPFYLSLHPESDVTKYIDYIKDENPEELYFVRSKSEYGEVSLVFKINEYKFVTHNTGIHLSSNVGGTGSRNLWELYILVKTLKDEFKYGRILEVGIYGRTLDEEKFDQLSHGFTYPPNILKPYAFQCHWWDDLTILNTENTYAHHGQEFLDAQRIIREEIEHREQRF